MANVLLLVLLRLLPPAEILNFLLALLVIVKTYVVFRCLNPTISSSLPLREISGTVKIGRGPRGRVGYTMLGTAIGVSDLYVV
jgi:hypothetical protein